jgi:hypothetical protein
MEVGLVSSLMTLKAHLSNIDPTEHEKAFKVGTVVLVA